ncbi:MAG TPA: hypothetical protein VEV81_00850 [Pyrinomonadaceae bacterium]|nr:hypothetical protein [Pyrinomonadaceae bacterium]
MESAVNRTARGRESGGASEEEPTREEERDDVAEPDAPTAAEENEGMSTILSAEPLTGVQDDNEDDE